jgi:filamentous hemagglutinin family protein
VFNINSPESVTFSGPNSIDNILGRVTGGSASTIDGLLRSTIPEANLFFLNPAGVVFGPNATLNIQGSFHVSTADYLKLADGTRFDALPSSNDALLTTAPPEAFGFLGENPAGISIQGSLLQVLEGETLSVVGGDIQIANGSLYAPGGRIDMVSVASPGEVLPNAPDLGVASFERLGRIEVSHSSSERPVIDGNKISNVDASGEGGGRIFIRGGEFVAENAFIFADTRGSGEGQGIDMGVTGQVTMRNGARITADTFGSGSGGDLAVEAGSLEVLGSAQIGAGTFSSGQGGNLLVEADRVLLSGSSVGISGPLSSGLFTGAFPGSSGDSGDLTVRAGNLEVLGGAQISAGTFSSGQGGNLLVEADRMLLSGSGVVIGSRTFPSGLFTSAFRGSSGDAGDLTVRAGSLEVREGAEIGANTFSSGQGGNLLVEAGSLEVLGGAQIGAGTLGSGQGGNLLVEADRMLLSGFGVDIIGIFPSGLFTDAASDSSGDAGDLTVRAGSLEVREGANISADTFGSGQGGNLLVEAGSLEVREDADISASTFSSGQGGNLLVEAGRLEVLGGAQIGAGTFGSGQGGNLLVKADRMLLSGFPSGLFTDAAPDSSGDAGDLMVRAGSLEVREGALISAGTDARVGAEI